MKKHNGALITTVLCTFCIMLTVFSETAADAASSSLGLCLKSLIPSLFPYMVASSMLVSFGAAERLAKIFPIARLFGINGKSSGAIILGALCGFPLGAKVAVDLYKRGTVSKAEAEALISVANNTGPSFAAAVIGTGFWKSASFGWKLYFFQIISAVAAGIIVNKLIFKLPKREEKEITTPCTERFSVVFTRAVSDSVGAVLTVCGFVIIFSVICAYIKIVTDTFSPILTGVIFSVAELTGASEYAAEIAASGFLAHGGFLAGFALGFSGLSVFCQAASFTVSESLSLKRTFAVKTLQGIFCGILGAIAAASEEAVMSQSAFNPFFIAVPVTAAAAVLMLFLIKNAMKA